MNAFRPFLLIIIILLSFFLSFFLSFLSTLFWLSCWFSIFQRLNYLAFQSFDFECTWRRLFQKLVVLTQWDIYDFIFCIGFPEGIGVGLFRWVSLLNKMKILQLFTLNAYLYKKVNPLSSKDILRFQKWWNDELLIE